MSTVDVSVVIPAYNIEKYITKTLDCLKIQTCTNFEILVVNDGSSDNTLALLDEFVLNNTEMNIKIINQKNAGVSVARNVGMDYAKGTYILFLDGDDLVEEIWIETLYRKITSKNADFVYCGKIRVDEKENLINEADRNLIFFNECISGKEVVMEVLSDKVSLNIGTFMFRKEIAIIHGICFSKNIKYGEDLDFEFRLLMVCAKVVGINKQLMKYLLRDGSAMQSVGTLDFLSDIRVLYNFGNSIQGVCPVDKKIKWLLVNYRIPKCIVNILSKWSIKNNINFFYSLLSRKWIRVYLRKAICSLTHDYKLAVKCLVLLLIPKLFLKQYNSKKYKQML